MAIERKIKLYVSDAAGEAKSAKYYRINLASEKESVDRFTNIYKGLVRFYAKVSGDKFYVGMVAKTYSWATIVGIPSHSDEDAIFKECASKITPSIPEKLLNDGEGYLRIGEIYQHGIGFDNSAFTSMISTVPESLNAEFAQKSTLFTHMIISDIESDLSQYIPADWTEFYNIDLLLADIKAWSEEPIEDRGLIFREYTIDEFKQACDFIRMVIGVREIDVLSGAVSTADGITKELCTIVGGENATITLTSNKPNPVGKAYYVTAHFSSGNTQPDEIAEEVAFNGNTITINYKSDDYNTRGYLVLAGDAIDADISVTKP